LAFQAVNGNTRYSYSIGGLSNEEVGENGAKKMMNMFMCAYAPKGQPANSPGHRPGKKNPNKHHPERAKAI
jgi:hypothetical protein